MRGEHINEYQKLNWEDQKAFRRWLDAWLIVVANSPTLMRVIFMISLLAVRSISPMADDFYAFRLGKSGTGAPNCGSCPLPALSGHASRVAQCPLSGVKRT